MDRDIALETNEMTTSIQSGCFLVSMAWLLMLACISNCTSEDGTGISEAEAKLLQIREGLSNVVLEMSFKSFEIDNEERKVQNDDLDRHWITRDGWRSDQRRGGPGSPYWYREFSFAGKNGFYSNEEGVVEFNSIGNSNRPANKADPRHLGLGIMGLRSLIGPPALVVGQWPALKRGITTEVIAGQKYTNTSYTIHTSATYEMRFIENPLRLIETKSHYVSPDGTVEDSLSTCLYENTDLLKYSFPSSVNHKDFRNGRLVSEAFETVVTAEFRNDASAMAVDFSLAAIGVPEGANVIDMAAASQGVWTGEDVLSLEDSQPTSYLSNRKKLILASLSVVFAAIFLAIKYVGSKK